MTEVVREGGVGDSEGELKQGIENTIIVACVENAYCCVRPKQSREKWMRFVFDRTMIQLIVLI